MTHMTKSTRAMLLGAALLLGGCRNDDILNTNQPTVETLTGSPSKAALARAARGVFAQANADLGGIIQQWGIYGREGYNLLGNDPRETGEELRGPQDPQGRAGGVWGGSYIAIRTINTYLAALPNGTGITPEEISASEGFAKTLKAYHYFKVALRSGPYGMPLDVDRPITDDPAPFVSFNDAMTAISALLDEANADLADAGSVAFPFTMAPGYTGFETPATFSRFNRGLAAKVLVMRATFLGCTTCWTQAITALDNSFLTTAGLPASLATGVYFAFSIAAGEPNNPITENNTSTRYWVHPSIMTGAQQRPGGLGADLRVTTKTVLGSATRSLNDLTGTYKPAMYNNPANLAEANLDADIPWLKNEELILLRAEARWNAGNKAGALADIDLIRVNAGGLAATSLNTGSSDDAFVTELLYNRLYSLMWEQGTRWIDARRYNRLAALPVDRPAPPNGPDTKFTSMLVPAGECDARGLVVPCNPLTP
jgi:hypothetical protein